MKRPCIQTAALSSGVPEDALTTHADLIPELGDVFPYNEVVCLKDGFKEMDPIRLRWEDYLWRQYMETYMETHRSPRSYQD